MNKRITGLVVVILCIGLLSGSQAIASQALDELVEAARKEGGFDVMMPSVGEKGSRDIIAAFNKRFGLNIRVRGDLAGQESQKFNQAVTETKAGVPPTFDLMQGEASNVLNLKDAGGAEQIANWRSLMAEIAPEAHKMADKISPSVLGGYGFLWSTRTVALLYNPKVISEKELPSTWKEMGDPKYKGVFSVPPWISVALMGALAYDRAEWLEIVKSWGRNKRQVLTYSAGVERMLLGDIKFLYGNAGYFFEHKAKDPNAPIAINFFEDLTTMRQVLYVTRKGARNPNGAKLFAIWSSGAEFSDIVQKYSPDVENLVLGRGATTQRILGTFKGENINPVSWFDGPKELEKFLWFETKEGKEYARAIARAQREGK
ncbi:MAG: extracellular solute-binding protein [Candidatus Binatia bacterium]